MYYLTVKTLHLWLVISWFAGLFYLPRIFVNLATVTLYSHSERDRLLLMATKLYRFMSILAILAITTGFWLWFVTEQTLGGWLHLKITLVVLLAIYHIYCKSLLNTFDAQKNQRSHTWYRWFNELPVLLLLIILGLAVFKPF